MVGVSLGGGSFSTGNSSGKVDFFFFFPREKLMDRQRIKPTALASLALHNKKQKRINMYLLFSTSAIFLVI